MQDKQRLLQERLWYGEVIAELIASEGANAVVPKLNLESESANLVVQGIAWALSSRKAFFFGRGQDLAQHFPGNNRICSWLAQLIFC
ncbi:MULTISPECIES: hypothetical protein [unclassified Paenibacillus]|uniref:hypothetical protein n=1 Tax=unclassified Paenibacillus TaxID=185978 RepID=UPI0009318FF4|nr:MULTISPECIES: hypothetical protein [unclassified Paenibacillus]